ncbi:DM4/DM12 family [Popillia japonica]|uniref:DM4/DM12 family n=1 Tax=Popillia japonica TaxID=7064 RepID=A0AAW1KE04_POPJA
MMFLKKVIFVYSIANSIKLLVSLGSTQFTNKVLFPYSPYSSPFVGLFLAIAFPLDLPDYNVFVSLNLEANYNLPQNVSTYEYPPIVESRSFMDRKDAYAAIENKLEAHGYPGKPCLLRTICEASEYSMEHNGVFADILHIVLTPSSSKSEGLVEYEEAEKYGSTNLHCKKYVKTCSLSVLDLVSALGDVIH